MRIQWDPGKGALLKAERGITFEELADAVASGGLIDSLDNPNHAGQALLIVRCKESLWVVVAEPRGEIVRYVTAYPSRKMRKKYGN